MRTLNEWTTAEVSGFIAALLTNNDLAFDTEFNIGYSVEELDDTFKIWLTCDDRKYRVYIYKNAKWSELLMDIEEGIKQIKW